MIKNGAFDGKRWAEVTREMLVGINRLSDSRWIAILELVRTSVRENKKHSIIQQGPPPEPSNDIGIVLPDSDPVYE